MFRRKMEANNHPKRSIYLRDKPVTENSKIVTEEDLTTESILVIRRGSKKFFLKCSGQ